MATKSEQKEIAVEVRLPDSGYPKCMYFNRFRIQREKDFVLLHFGMDSGTEGILDHYSCTITYDGLENNKHSLIDYLNRSPKPKEKPVVWTKSLPVDRVDAFDIFVMSFYKNIAETVRSLYPITIGSQLPLLKTSEPTTNLHVLAIKAHPLVLLRSNTETQMQLIVALYEE